MADLSKSQRKRAEARQQRRQQAGDSGSDEAADTAPETAEQESSGQSHDAVRQAAKVAAAIGAAGAAAAAARVLSSRDGDEQEEEQQEPERREAEPEQNDPRAEEPDEQGHEEPEREEPREPVAGAGGGDARRVLDRARDQLEDLLGRPVESVSSLERTHDGWVLALEVVEVRRIPETTDILASYEMELDDDLNLRRYHQGRRYHRAHADGAEES